MYDPEVKGRCFPQHVLTSTGYTFGGWSSCSMRNDRVTESIQAYNVLVDLFCAVAPAFVIGDLKMGTRTKYALSVLMGLGVL